MFAVEPFIPAHLGHIKLQKLQMQLSDWVSREQASALAQYPSYTALDNGVPIGAAGVIPLWPGRAQGWAFLSEMGPQNFLKCHKAVKHFLDGCEVRRLEISVDCEFKQAHKWAKKLGFTMECERMPHYSPDGQDCASYVRIL
tara:strand:+ start:529 stop:954 length:426 start_codon:yes stop_codon:yes gene_type:complete